MEHNLEPYEVFAKQMEEKYPKMFANKYGGFAVGEGWWPILEALCANIQSHIDWRNEQFNKYGRGTEVQQVVVEQIKEKFGGLRFYCQGGDDEITGMIRMAESWAGRSCETCGSPGSSRGGGWIRTLCDKHHAEAEAKRAEYMKTNGLEE
jgi:hypothetical protein